MSALTQVWVDARPFLAKIDFLARNLTESRAVVALAIGLTPDQMIAATTGPPVEQISHDLAEIILNTTVDELRHELRLYVSARTARRVLRRLSLAGWSLAELSDLTQIDAATVAGLLNGRDRFCPAVVELRLLSHYWRLQAEQAA